MLIRRALFLLNAALAIVILYLELIIYTNKWTCTGMAIGCRYMACSKRTEGNTRDGDGDAMHGDSLSYEDRSIPVPQKVVKFLPTLMLPSYTREPSAAFYIHLFHLFNRPPLNAENLPPYHSCLDAPHLLCSPQIFINYLFYI